jgi:hypothetical protein
MHTPYTASRPPPQAGSSLKQPTGLFLYAQPSQGGDNFYLQAVSQFIKLIPYSRVKFEVTYRVVVRRY